MKIELFDPTFLRSNRRRGGISVTTIFDAKKNAESQNAKRTFERSEHHCFMKRTLIEQWLNIVWRNVFVSFERSWKETIESMEKLSWKYTFWFSQAYWRFYGFSRVAISKWSMRLAWSYARLAVCSLQILRTAQTSLLKAISHCLMAYCLWYRLFSILTPMAESLITRSVNSHWIQNWSRTRSESSTFGSARWS